MIYWTLSGAVLSILSIGLLCVLLVVWVRNYRQYQTSLTVGFLCFGIALLLENLSVLYLWYMMEMMYVTATSMQQLFLLVSFLEFLALIAITRVTLQ